VIVFVSDEESVEAGSDEKPSRAYERYVRERLQGTEYLYIMIGLRRLHGSLERIRGSWQGMSRDLALAELEGLLQKQHELEWQVERIKDVFVREYVYGQLDSAASSRRYLAEEIRWDVESGGSGTIELPR